MFPRLPCSFVMRMGLWALGTLVILVVAQLQWRWNHSLRVYAFSVLTGAVVVKCVTTEQPCTPPCCGEI